MVFFCCVGVVVGAFSYGVRVRQFFFGSEVSGGTLIQVLQNDDSSIVEEEMVEFADTQEEELDLDEELDEADLDSNPDSDESPGLKEGEYMEEETLREMEVLDDSVVEEVKET